MDITDSTETFQHSHGTSVSDRSVSDGRRMQRLEIIDESPDTETLFFKASRRLISWLRSIVPVRPLGDDTPTYRRMLTKRFWSRMFEIANEGSGDLLWHFIVGLGALILYFGALLLGIMSAYPVVGDSVAVSDHPQCGLVLPPTANQGDAVHFALGKKYYNDISRESRQYAKSCYGHGSTAEAHFSPDSCSFFYKPTIDYAVMDDDLCPFRHGEGPPLCLDGENTAYTVTTGTPEDVLVDVSTIGINSPLRYKFHRSITCSPLIMDGLVHPFIDANGTLGNHYLYGNRTGDWSCTSDLPYCTFELMMYPNVNQQYSMLQVSPPPIPGGRIGIGWPTKDLRLSWHSC
jgi:hypothetical protein